MGDKASVSGTWILAMPITYHVIFGHLITMLQLLFPPHKSAM